MVIRHPGHHPDDAATVSEAAEALVLVWSRLPDVVGERVSTSQLRALLVIDRYDGINLNAFAAELGVVASSASRLCDRLAAAGLLRREISEHNRRFVTLSLTSDGERLLRMLAEHRQAAVGTILDQMSSAGRRALAAGLAEFTVAARATREADTVPDVG